jgi:hypothetical protein
MEDLLGAYLSGIGPLADAPCTAEANLEEFASEC